MIEDYSTLTPEQVDAEIAKYRALGDIEVAPEETLTDDAAKLTELTRLAEAHGQFYTLTQEDLDANPTLVEEKFAAGENVLLTSPELKEIQDAVAAKKAAEAPEGTTTEELVVPDGNEGANVTGVATPIAPAAEEETIAQKVHDDLVYLGKTVLGVRDRLINGKTYKEVDVPGETHTLTHDEFNENVTPRAA